MLARINLKRVKSGETDKHRAEEIQVAQNHILFSK